MSLVPGARAPGSPIPGPIEDHALNCFVDCLARNSLFILLASLLGFAVGVIGTAFEGGYYRATGVFRPQANCTMREEGVPFCFVCQEALARSIHEAAGRKFDDRKYHEETPIPSDD